MLKIAQKSHKVLYDIHVALFMPPAALRGYSLRFGGGWPSSWVWNRTEGQRELGKYRNALACAHKHTHAHTYAHAHTQTSYTHTSTRMNTYKNVNKSLTNTRKRSRTHTQMHTYSGSHILSLALSLSLAYIHTHTYHGTQFHLQTHIFTDTSWCGSDVQGGEDS